MKIFEKIISAFLNLLLGFKMYHILISTHLYLYFTALLLNYQKIPFLGFKIGRTALFQNLSFRLFFQGIFSNKWTLEFLVIKM